MARILITGAEGNLGGAIARRAMARHRVVGIDVANWGDLDAVMAEGVDVIVHAAYDIRHNIVDTPASVLESNVGITGILLEKARESAARQFVYVSSSAVYGESMSTSESTACRPTTMYGRLKLLNEDLITAFGAKYGIETSVVRPFNLYGGRDHFSVLRRLAESVRHGVPFTLNNDGRAMRDFVHVDDAAQVIVRVIETPEDCARLNVGTGRVTRIGDLVERVREVFPSLRLAYAESPEVEYCRADTTRLERVCPIEWRRVEDTWHETFADLLGQDVGFPWSAAERVGSISPMDRPFYGPSEAERRARGAAVH